MRICIHRGTREIGGTCIEIEADGQRLALEVGLPLEADDTESLLPSVPGFREPDESLLGVIISHPHQDHYGLAKYLRPGLAVIIGADAQRILAAANNFVPSGLAFNWTINLRDREFLKLGSFIITPYLVDHSAYDSYALLIETQGKRLFYSGDLRGHGRKASLFERLVNNPPQNVDMLLLEGSCLGRPEAEGDLPRESELEVRFIEEIASTKGIVLAWCSGQNIDRIVTIFRACKQTGRKLILDLYTAEILRATGNPRIPQGHWSDVRVFIPEWQRRLVKKKQLFHLLEPYKKNRIFPESLGAAARHSVMLFRPSMMAELGKAECLTDARLIYSLWQGYLKEERQTPFLNLLDDRGIPLIQVHTSGHASVVDLQRLARAIKARMIVPVHTFEPGRYSEFFENVEIKRDGIWWEI